MYKTTRTTVDNISRTPILAPEDCNNYALYFEPDGTFPSGAEIMVRTDGNDATTEKKLPAGSQETLAVPNYELKKRFLKNTTVVTVQMVPAGTGTVVATFS